MRALIISVDLGDPDFLAHAEEFAMLAKGAGAEIVGTLTARRDRPDAKFFIGSGKADEGVGMAQALLADIVLFDQPLSPAQQRNLERLFNLRVVDRVALILDIFALRAKSHEGKLQVELAQLQHLATRLTRMWSHLERQRGGIGMRGPGESQLEMDRRMIGAKVVLRERLDKVERQRVTQRRPSPGARAVGVAGGLYQRRQVHAVQCTDSRRQLRGRPAVRHAGHHHAADLDRRRRLGRRRHSDHSCI